MVRNDRVISGADDAAKARYKSDISFVGSTYQEKCPFNRAKLSDKNRGFFDGIIEAQLKVYGYNFIENTITDQLAEEFLDSTPNSYRFPDGFRKNDRATVAQLYVSVKVAEQERIRALRMLSDEFSVDIYTGSDTSSMPNIHNRGFARSLDEMPLIFNQSKINLNITAKSIRSGLSLRVFDVLGCGGFLITNYQAELPEYFEIGRDLVAYESMEHLQELCRYYLAHDDEREEIAAHGRETVIANYTYDILLLKMIDMAFPAI
jgi:spore maturation protein CgeB